MNSVNKTLYIPLYGKAQVSKRGIILPDKKAEAIWQQVQFPLKGKAKSKWLTYYMSMRAKVFDDWTEAALARHPHATVLHIGCGMDARVLRLGQRENPWYDVDFPSVIAQREKYYDQTETYHMLGADASQPEWVGKLPDNACAIVILEGISMYLKNEDVRRLFQALQEKFPQVCILMDVYTTFGAKASRYQNPIHDVGVTLVHGIDDPECVLPGGKLAFAAEHTMTPEALISQLPGFDRWFFTRVFAGNLTQKIYRLFEYTTQP